jgi:hypothetical protein
MIIQEYTHALRTFELATSAYINHIENKDEPLLHLYRGYIVEAFGVDPCVNKSGRSDTKMSEAKHCLRAMMAFNTRMNLQRIAELTGAKSHSTVSCSLRAHKNLMETDRTYAAKVMAVGVKIQSYKRDQSI